MNKHELSAQSTSDCSAGGSSLSLTLNGVVFLHLRLVVVVQAVHRLSLHVFPLAALRVHRGPHLLQLLVSHLEVRDHGGRTMRRGTASKKPSARPEDHEETIC